MNISGKNQKEDLVADKLRIYDFDTDDEAESISSIEGGRMANTSKIKNQCQADPNQSPLPNMDRQDILDVKTKNVNQQRAMVRFILYFWYYQPWLVF